MDAKSFLKATKADFFTGVPDSLLKPLCDEIYNEYGISNKHIVAANEGNAVGLAAGYHLSTGKIPLVYLQNSGLGNIINPVASLLNEKVYGIPCIFVVGWRGEPNVKDEPQHIFQGEITVKLLKDIGIHTVVIDKGTSIDEIEAELESFKIDFEKGKSIAFVARKGTFTTENKIKFSNSYTMCREEIIEHIVAVSNEDVIVSTTGKASRELFEIREKNKQSHKCDFLTVGSMGHSSSIALSVALNKPNQKIWCIDGDGAAIMHLGSMAILGNQNPGNLVHIIINNSSHETVGGMPTVSQTMDLSAIAKACGYEKVAKVTTFEELDKQLIIAKRENKLSFIEVFSSQGARADLGRPTTTAMENKNAFTKYLNQLH